jgi:hypothetical protein
MSKSLSSIVQRLRGTSPLADALLERRFSNFLSESSNLSSDAPVDEVLDAVIRNTDLEQYSVSDLVNVIATLTDSLLSSDNKVAELETLLDAKHEHFDDYSIAESIDTFAKTLVGKKVPDLKNFYTRQIFVRMKKETRTFISSALLDYADSQNKRPADLWITIKTTEGSLGE